jgi:hypothetical protein
MQNRPRVAFNKVTGDAKNSIMVQVMQKGPRVAFENRNR